MKRFFHAELQDLHNQLVQMGEKALESVKLAGQCLMQKKFDLAGRVFLLDDDIDELEKTIDANAIRYITLRAPVASDVRLLTVAMKINHDLERIGDEATSIARKAHKMSQFEWGPEILCGLPQMAQMVETLLRESLDTFISDDYAAAIKLPMRDKVFISKSYERIGDHATNIAEEVVYLLCGEDVRHSAEVKRSQP